MRKIKILIVDDEHDFVELIKIRLRKWGYSVIAAYNGKDALDSLEMKPDIIILDCYMPKMDGITALEKIRKTDKKTPVIILTAYPDIDMMNNAQKLGIIAFIPKITIEVNLRALLEGAARLIKPRKNNLL